MMLIRFLISFIIIFICANITLAQVDTILCGTDPESIADVGELEGVTYTLKILLVEFDDVHHKTPAYTITNFNNLFISNGVYVSPNMYSPDNQQVFGSMRDYYSIMSDGDFTLTGYVVNSDNNRDGIPEWLTLPENKSTYDDEGFANWGWFLDDVIAAANNAGLNITTSTTTKLAVIYAGHTYRLGGLVPHAGTYDGKHLYINGELFAPGAPYDEERQDAKFSEIGINVHEFAHLLGMPDLGINGFFDVMNAGCYTGPNYRAACPMPFNPQTRYLKGWIGLESVTQNRTFQSDYNLRDPEVFKIQKTSDPNYYWLIETRRFNQTMTIGSTTCNDYNYYLFRNFFTNSLTQGVFVWKVVSNNYSTLLHADGKNWAGYPQITQGVPFPGTGNVEVLSPWSDTRTSPAWVPNTKPSTNVGMEIVDQGTGWYSLDLYATNPEDASPSKPQNLTVTVSANDHPYLSWTANTEPDLNSYIVEKYVTFELGWQYLATRSSSQNYYEDLSETVCNPPPGQNCGSSHWIRYRVKAGDTQSKVSVPSDSVMINVNGGMPDKINLGTPKVDVTEYSLSQNYPNPFNPTTTISYTLKEDGIIQLRVYDVLGKEVAELVNEKESAGTYSVVFNSNNLPSGIYFYQLNTGGFIETKKMILLR